MPAWRRPPALRVEVLADTRLERVCRGCGTPLTWYTRYRDRRRVPFEFSPRIVLTDRAVDDGTPVAILDRPKVHICRQRGAA